MSHLARIIVSYSAPDTDWCRAFVEALRWSGSDVWTADDHVSGDVVDRELRARPVCIIVLSPSALMTAHVERVVRAALSLRDAASERLLLAVVAEYCKLPPQWPKFEVLGGPNGARLAPTEAARRANEIFEVSAMRTRRAPVVTVTIETARQAWERGQALRTQGRVEEALVAYDQALALDPAAALAWYGKGNVLRDMMRYDEASVAYDRAVTLDPLSVSAWYGKGLVLAALGERRGALEAYDNAVRLNPRFALGLVAQAQVLREMGRHQDALEAYEDALALDPSHAPTWRRKGDTLRDLARQGEKARRMTLSPSRRPGVQPMRGQRQIEDALEAYDHAISLAPRYLKAWNNKIHLLDDLDRRSEAAEARRQRERAIHGNSRTEGPQETPDP
ncbi:MAG TPA: toll/interleukin-1 receptor domain-containing protein [Ktedonobacterales bacterium]